MYLIRTQSPRDKCINTGKRRVYTHENKNWFNTETVFNHYNDVLKVPIRKSPATQLNFLFRLVNKKSTIRIANHTSGEATGDQWAVNCFLLDGFYSYQNVKGTSPPVLLTKEAIKGLCSSCFKTFYIRLC